MESGNAFQLYQNSGYKNDREKKKTLVLDLQEDDLGGTGADDDLNTTFTVNLQEPFIIDSLCDVYLDTMSTYDAMANTGENKHAFLVGIDQFPIQTNTNNPKCFNKLVIPNEDSSGGGGFKVHKGRKMNYVCQMNPQTLRQLSGSVTGMNGKTMDKNSDDGGMMPVEEKYRVIMEFVFVSRE